MHNTSQAGRRTHTPGLIFGLMMVFILLLSSCSAPPAKIYRVGILSGAKFLTSIADGFKAKMTELGYVEGKNIVYELQQSNFDTAKEQEVLKQFVADNVDLIVVLGTGPALAAKAAAKGTDIPVLFASAFVEGNDLIESIRQPGGNITGVRLAGPDIAVKRLEILHQMAPQAKRVWLPYLRDYANVPPILEVLRPTAASLGITLVEVPVSSPKDVQADLRARAQSADIGLDAILLVPEPMSVVPDSLAAICQFAVEHNVPIGTNIISAEGQGIVFSYMYNNIDVGERAAPLADKIFKGMPAGTIPVISPENELRINYKVARAFGLTVPESLLSQAVEIVR
jgi:putative ABC transport system substrate-binding protein